MSPTGVAASQYRRSAATRRTRSTTSRRLRERFLAVQKDRATPKCFSPPSPGVTSRRAGCHRNALLRRKVPLACQYNLTNHEGIIVDQNAHDGLPPANRPSGRIGAIACRRNGKPALGRISRAKRRIGAFRRTRPAPHPPFDGRDNPFRNHGAGGTMREYIDQIPPS